MSIAHSPDSPAFANPTPAMSVERLLIPPGSSRSIHLASGDRLALHDPEGLQPATVEWPSTARDVLGPESAARAVSGPRGQFMLEALSPGGEAGQSWSCEAGANVVVQVRVPGSVMEPGHQDTCTEIEARIERSQPPASDLPAPLAPVKAEWRVSAATAVAYTVKQGDWIQIIDVSGRQCSDFLAFDATSLAAGHEYGLDPTTTRTLMGTANPGPGLHSKYFDARQRPLLEIVRDTVGRHDTFLLACSAKYYEDMGYPGHDNCTDNFNAALAPHGVWPRAGWPAINFFYNTNVGADDSMGFDEPWSRPGDYVLLRALTDLVCASSSCTDDIDPANGWNPTDIHVRVYDAAHAFSPGIAHRMTADAAPRLSRPTGFHPSTSALTRRFVEYRGYWLAEQYDNYGPLAEYWACREKAAVMDLSPLRKFEITGPDAEALMQYAVTRNVKKLAVGQVVYTALCHEHGGMLDDGTVFRLCQNNFRLVCGDEYCGPWLRGIAAQRGLKVWIRSSTDQLHNIALQGPLAREILAPLVATPAHQSTVHDLKWFRFTIGKLSGIPVLVSRTGYTGELGYEIFCHPDRAPEVWNAVWEAGAPHGLAPLGLTALDMVRIEAGLAFAGYEFCDQTDPFEAGIGFAVAADGPDDYAGREALERRRAHPARVLVGLDIEGNEPAVHGDAVYAGRAQVGVVTSGIRSPVLGKCIALARVDVSLGAPGTALEVGKLDGLQKRLAATVVRFPHYDPEKTRVRA